MSSTPSSRRRITPCFVHIESDGIVGNFSARQHTSACVLSFWLVAGGMGVRALTLTPTRRVVMCASPIGGSHASRAVLRSRDRDRHRGGTCRPYSPNHYNAGTRTTGSDVYYPNCAAARAAGVAPIYKGQPGTGLGLTATATASPANSAAEVSPPSSGPVVRTGGSAHPGVTPTTGGQLRPHRVRIALIP